MPHRCIDETRREIRNVYRSRHTTPQDMREVNLLKAALRWSYADGYRKGFAEGIAFAKEQLNKKEG